MTIAIVLAAGDSTRMVSDISKMFHKICGMRMCAFLFKLVRDLKYESVFVIDEMHEEEFSIINKSFGHEDNILVSQEEKLGTGHAVKVALEKMDEEFEYIPDEEEILILYGDVPFISEDIIKGLHNSLRNNNSDIVMLGFEESNNKNYGEMVINSDNRVGKIVEFSEMGSDFVSCGICNSGILISRYSKLKELVFSIDLNSNKYEYLLTDIVEICNKSGGNVSYILCSKEEAMGINTRQDLAKANVYYNKLLIDSSMDSGVSFIDPSNTYLSYDTKIGCDTVIFPGVYIDCGVEIGRECVVKPSSYLCRSKIAHMCEIGPYASIIDSSLSQNSVIGNFVEVKRSYLGSDVKAKHLSYLGDVSIGMNVNIGAGCVVANYNSRAKTKRSSAISDFADVGANSTLVSPVNIGYNSTVAAGTIVCGDIEDNSLCIGRVRSENKIGYYDKNGKNEKGNTESGG